MTTQHTQDWETTFKKKEDGKDEVYCYWDVCQKCKHSQPSGHAFCSNCGRRDKEIPTPPYLDIDTLITRTKAETIEECKVTENTSDGYHTFKELYEFRKLYNAALFNTWASGHKEGFAVKHGVHKSKKHSDGQDCFGGGWFIVMAQLPTGQISNHYEMKDWEFFNIPEKEKADEWDGHTPQDVLVRLTALEKLNDKSQ